MLASVVLDSETLVVSQIKSDKRDFNPQKFLSTMSEGSKAVGLCNKQAVFVHGAPADVVFYNRGGKVGLTVVSKTGKKAAIGVLSDAGLKHAGQQRAKSSL